MKQRFLLNFQDNVENCDIFLVQKGCDGDFPADLRRRCPSDRCGYLHHAVGWGSTTAHVQKSQCLAPGCHLKAKPGKGVTFHSGLHIADKDHPTLNVLLVVKLTISGKM